MTWWGASQPTQCSFSDSLTLEMSPPVCFLNATSEYFLCNWHLSGWLSWINMWPWLLKGSLEWGLMEVAEDEGLEPGC